ncbi:hypothetical protein R1sor_005708 [Riccia sorocarpa]|uniref:Uncharacterized protein n=1 Tax=Riccia sorocarpa TaxID=122646 RepID=A0ABD3HKL5_9MARC
MTARSRLCTVEKAICSGEDVLFQNVAVYVSNYEAPCCWPSKFTYRACNYPLHDGRHCLLSMERRIACTDGHRGGVTRPVFRFQLHLADGSMDGRTLKATVFNSASILLGRNATELRALPPASQERIVGDACSHNARFCVHIRTHRGKAVIEQMIPYDHATIPPVQRTGIRLIGPHLLLTMAPQLAIAGQHYQVYRKSMYGVLYVCYIGDCPRNASNLERFVPHMKEHGFLGVDRDSDRRQLQTLKNTTWLRTPRLRQPRDTASECDYIRLRGNLKAQWSQTLKRKQRAFLSEAQHSAQFRYGPKPERPGETIFTVLIDGMLLLDKWRDAGFWADRGDYQLQEYVLEACVKTTTVSEWCKTLQNHLQQFEGWPTEEDSQKMASACRALTGIFPAVFPVEVESQRNTMRDLRNRLIQSGVKQLNNLLTKFTKEFQVSADEAVTRARLDDLLAEPDADSDIVPDSSDSSEHTSGDNQDVDCANSSVPPTVLVQFTQPDEITAVPDLALSTPEKAIIPSMSSDEETFRKRLNLIYISPDGVATQPEYLWRSPSSEVVLSQIVLDLRDTYATVGASSPDPVAAPKRITHSAAKRVLAP